MIKFSLFLFMGLLLISCGPKEEEVSEPGKNLTVDANLVFFYYQDLEKAERFYSDILGMWVAIKNFSKRSEPDTAGLESSIRYIPLEGGLKIRFNKGLINPYLGAGIAYHQYKEDLSTREINEKKIGFLGQAGCFVKIAENLVLDVYAHYRHCRIDIETEEINCGGLHFGAGLGFEF